MEFDTEIMTAVVEAGNGRQAYLVLVGAGSTLFGKIVHCFFCALRTVARSDIQVGLIVDEFFNRDPILMI